LKKLIAQSGGVGAREREKQKEAKITKKTASSQSFCISLSLGLGRFFSLCKTRFSALCMHTYTRAA
jgi:hypothetical protein